MLDLSNNEESPDVPRSIDSIVTEGYTFSLLQNIQFGFKRFGAEAGIYVAFTLVYFAISMAANALPYIGDVVGLMIEAPLIAGFIYYSRLQRNNDFRDFSNFFTGFKNGYWPIFVAQRILVNLIIVLVVLAIVLPIFWEPIQHFVSDLEKIETMSEKELGQFLVSIFTPAVIQAACISAAIALVVMTFFCLAPFFIVYRGFSAFQAIRASCRVVMCKYPMFLLFNLILWLIIIAGLMLCCVGLLAALTVFYLALASAYEEITGD